MSAKKYRPEIIQTAADICSLEKSIMNDRFNLSPTTSAYFRGHENKEYLLRPKISRIIIDIEKIKIAEDFISKKLSKYIQSGKINTDIRIAQSSHKYSNVWQLLYQAQHLEIPTRLLDITAEIRAAIYFSVARPEYDSINGELIIFYISQCVHYKDSIDPYINDQNNYAELNPYDLKSTIFINASHHQAHVYTSNVLAEQRRYKQFGRFVAQSTNTLLEPLDNRLANVIIERILIPKDNKEKLRKELQKEGITPETMMFPYVESKGTIDLKSEINTFIENLMKE